MTASNRSDDMAYFNYLRGHGAFLSRQPPQGPMPQLVSFSFSPIGATL